MEHIYMVDVNPVRGREYDMVANHLHDLQVDYCTSLGCPNEKIPMYLFSDIPATEIKNFRKKAMAHKRKLDGKVKSRNIIFNKRGIVRKWVRDILDKSPEGTTLKDLLALPEKELLKISDRPYRIKDDLFEKDDVLNINVEMDTIHNENLESEFGNIWTTKGEFQ